MITEKGSRTASCSCQVLWVRENFRGEDGVKIPHLVHPEGGERMNPKIKDKNIMEGECSKLGEEEVEKGGWGGGGRRGS